MKYKNIAKESVILVGFGTFKPGETLESDQEITNSNFELVKESAEKIQPKESIEK